jgi:protein TonB
MAKRVEQVIRLLATSAFGLVIAAGVFFGLTQLTGGSATQPLLAVRDVRFTRLIVETETRTKPPREKPTPRRGAPPPIPEPGPGLGTDELPAVKVGYEEPLTPGRERQRSRFVAGNDGGPTVLVRIPPAYPPNGRGDGYVLVEFDITELGSVANLRVVDASPRGMFEKSALQAVARWRYRPAVMDGRAVERRGVRVKLSFQLERA